jgi:transaldolase
VLNVYQASDVGCDIITLTDGLIKKLELYNKSLTDYSRETVEMFHRDAGESGYQLAIETTKKKDLEVEHAE